MKKIITLSLIFIFAVFMASVVDAQNNVPGNGGQNSGVTGSPSIAPSPTMVQTQNQGMDTQIQNQGGQDNSRGEGVQNEQQTQNQGQEQQLQNQSQIQEAVGQGDQIGIANRQSAVAQAVQGLLDFANMEPGIGEQIRIVAQEQNQVQEKIVDKIDAIQTRNKVKTFLFGTDYKNVNDLRKEVIATENQIQSLNQLKEQIQNENHKTFLQDQIQLLQQEQTRLQEFLNANENKFSLFGWFVKIFVK